MIKETRSRLEFRLLSRIRRFAPSCQGEATGACGRGTHRMRNAWRQQASRSIQCRSCLGSVPLRCVLRPSRLPERNRHAGDFWRPKACLMTGLGQGEPNLSRIRRAKGVLAIACPRPFVGCHRMRTCVHCKLRNHGRPTRQRMGRHAFGSALTSMQNSSLAPHRRTRLLPIHIHGRPLCACALRHTRARCQ